MEMRQSIGSVWLDRIGHEGGAAVRYNVTILPTAARDLNGMSPDVARRVLRKIKDMQNDLTGDVKRLVDFNPSYRLRAGDWRVLFDIKGDRILVQRVRHWSEAY
jgi:mRNA interferase RelE/StbE